MKRLIIISIALFSLIQIGALGKKIFALEDALATGELHLFKAAPIDPYDPFRGRYVALSQENLRMKVEEGKVYGKGESIWVSVVKGEDGYSSFAGLTFKEDPAPKVRARVRYSSGDTLTIDPPFSRFYMNDKRAPQAERAYRKRQRREELGAYIAVRLKDGVGVIEDLYIDGKKIDEYLREEDERKHD
ncbi:MAG: hypothetical protein C0609_10170 [Deltaproteobacteria bacterium]|nr:MAG: hypothetical protein C0609_10170 [Deltaproteobacteria bacterium]